MKIIMMASVIDDAALLARLLLKSYLKFFCIWYTIICLQIMMSTCVVYVHSFTILMAICNSK